MFKLMSTGCPPYGLAQCKLTVKDFVKISMLNDFASLNRISLCSKRVTKKQTINNFLVIAPMLGQIFFWTTPHSA